MAKFDELDIAYHRSFLSKQAISPCNPGCHGQPYKGPFNGMDVGPILLPRKPVPYDRFPKLPSTAPPAPKFNQTYYYDYAAYRLTGTSLSYWPIVAKTDQDFSTYATPFERWCSKLASVHGALDPVVDDSLMVVGHVGFLNAMYFFKPAGLEAWGADTYQMNELEALRARNIPLFISRTGTTQREGYGNKPRAWATKSVFWCTRAWMAGW